MDVECFSNSVFIVLALTVVASAPIYLRRYQVARRRGEFRCRMCGNCCRFHIISLNDEDVRRLEETGHSDFYVKAFRERRLKTVNGRCVFSRDDKCTVHEIKPKVCREFPFKKLLGVTVCEGASNCPGLNEVREKIPWQPWRKKRRSSKDM